MQPIANVATSGRALSELPAVSTEQTRRLDRRARDLSWPPRRVVVAALTVSLAYFIGARFGLLLRLPGMTPSVMWPPNALLTCALLLVPPRWWAACLLAALPAHLTLHINTEWSTPLILGLFVSNCSEAIIGASLLRWLSDRPTRFDSLERVRAFVVAVVLIAPFLSSFLDAGIVATFGSDPYWRVWRTRLFSNALTELTVVPAVVGLVTHVRLWGVRTTAGRVLEAAVLISGLFGVWIVVSMWPDAQALIPGATRTPLAFLLPFMAWSALRFGPTGTSLALLTATVLTISSAARGISPFQSLTPGETLVGLQAPADRRGVAALRAGRVHRRAPPGLERARRAPAVRGAVVSPVKGLRPRPERSNGRILRARGSAVWVKRCASTA